MQSDVGNDEPLLLRHDGEVDSTALVWALVVVDRRDRPRIAVAPSPATRERQVYYIGKADRRPDGDVAERLADHLADDTKRPLFRGVMVVPLSDVTSEKEVTRFEGDVARYFGVPIPWPRHASTPLGRIRASPKARRHTFAGRLS